MGKSKNATSARLAENQRKREEEEDLRLTQETVEKAKEAQRARRRARGATTRLSDFMAWLHFQIHIYWISFACWMSNRIATGHFARCRRREQADMKREGREGQPSHHRKLVIVGDELARGVGDWVTMFNEVPPGFLRNQKWPVPLVFFHWHLFTMTVPRSSSADWMPMSAEERAAAKPTSAKQLPVFEAAFDPEFGIHADADVVVLCVGTMDRLGTKPERTGANVVTIAEELEARGKRVLIAHPIVTDFAKKNMDDDVVEKLRRRTDEVDVQVNRRWPNPERASTKVKLGPRLDIITSSINWRFTGHVLNHRGYKLWAKMWRDTLYLALKAVEAPAYSAIYREQTKAVAAKATNGSSGRTDAVAAADGGEGQMDKVKSS